MPRRGNSQALIKAIRHNPRMSMATKRKAIATLRTQLPRPQSRRIATYVQRSRTRRPSSRNLGWEGAKQVAEGTASIVSEPARKAMDIYRIVSGANKIRKYLKRKGR